MIKSDGTDLTDRSSLRTAPNATTLSCWRRLARARRAAQQLLTGIEPPLQSTLQRGIAHLLWQLVPLLLGEHRLHALDRGEVVVARLLKARLDGREYRREIAAALSFRDLRLDVRDEGVVLGGERVRDAL